MHTYETVILQAFAVFPLVALVITVPYLIHCYRAYGSALGLRAVIVYSFVLYLMCVYFLVVLPLPSIQAVAAMTSPYVQLVPFSFVADVAKEAHVVPGDAASYLTLVRNKAFYQAFFNMVMTIPFGMYLRYFFRCGLAKTVLLSFGLSLFFELTQLSGLYGIYPRPYRIFDVDDLMLNTLGGVVGYALVGPLMRWLPTREELDQASLRRGKDVSFTRRVLALAIDVVLAVVLGTVVCAVVDRALGGEHAWVPWLAVAAYFVVLPLVCGGRTPGYALLKLRVVAEDGTPARPWQLVVRFGCLVGLFVLLPWGVNAWCDWRVATGALEAGSAGLLRILVVGFCGFAGLYLFIRAALRGQLFYERWSRTKLVSTVGK